MTMQPQMVVGPSKKSSDSLMVSTDKTFNNFIQIALFLEVSNLQFIFPQKLDDNRILVIQNSNCLSHFFNGF